MQTNNLKYLKFVRFKEVEQWDLKRYYSNMFKSKFSACHLTKVIKEESQKYDISDPKCNYGILGVNNQTGIFDAYTENGSKINQKYKKMQTGWIAYNPYRVNVGSIGIKDGILQNEYISPAYVVFSCKETLLPYYLFLTMKTDVFNKIIRDNTTGSVRQNLSFEILKNLQIPLPTLTEQQALVSAYNSKIAEAEAKEAEAEKKIKEIEEYLLSELGIQKDEPNSNKTEESEGYLRFVRFKDVDRWDCYSEDISISSILKHAKYPIYQIGNVFEFVNRGWKKEEDYFRYVEIGSVDSLKGINSAEQLHTNKAPSRATQKIKKDDLIIGTTRPYLKKFAIVDEKYDDCVCSSGFQVIKPSNKYSLFFLLEYLMSFAAIKQFELYMTGALYPAITNTDLKKIQIPLPPLEIQNAIVAHISEQKEQIKQLKQEAKELRESALKEFENEIFG